VVTAIKENREDDADYYLSISNNLHTKLYRSVFRLEFGYGIYIAKQDIEDYVQDIINSSEDSLLDPLYYYAVYLLWKQNPSRPSYAKADRLRAYDCLRALSLFPGIQKYWLDPAETHVQEMEETSNIDLLSKPCDVEDDDYSDLIPPPGPADPESIWIQSKKKFDLESESMDDLMGMIGIL